MYLLIDIIFELVIAFKNILEEHTKEVFYKLLMPSEIFLSLIRSSLEELDQVIGILVEQKILDSFIKLDNDSFLYASKDRLLIVGCNNDILSVQRTYDYSFNYGF
jgi:hypothetical protein